MKARDAQRLRDTLLLVGFMIMLAGYLQNVLTIIGLIITLSCVIPDFLYNKCLHCAKRLGRNAGKCCQHCGAEID